MPRSLHSSISPVFSLKPTRRNYSLPTLRGHVQVRYFKDYKTATRQFIIEIP